MTAPVPSPELTGAGEWPATTWALAVEPAGQGQERGRLREGHDRLERERGPVGVVPVGDSPDRVAEDLDGRFRYMGVVVGGARLPQVLQFPPLFMARLDVRPRSDAGQGTQGLE